MSDKLESNLFTEDEYLHIIKMACKGRPQTKEQLLKVIRECESMKVTEQLLFHVMNGKLSVFCDENDEIKLIDAK